MVKGAMRASYAMAAKLAAILAVIGLLSCTKVQLYGAPTTLEGNVHVKIVDAYARGERIYVETYVSNGSDEPIRVDRDGWTLRLGTGETLSRSVGVTTQHDIYTIAPGAGRDVHVDFRKEGGDFTRIKAAWLIVAGIGYGKDVTPRVAGEVALSVNEPPAGAGQVPVGASAAPAADPEDGWSDAPPMGE
jgi:hypothetical protein